MFHQSPTSWAPNILVCVPPGSAASPGAITLSASFAGWLNDFFQWAQRKSMNSFPVAQPNWQPL